MGRRGQCGLPYAFSSFSFYLLVLSYVLLSLHSISPSKKSHLTTKNRQDGFCDRETDAFIESGADDCAGIDGAIGKLGFLLRYEIDSKLLCHCFTKDG